MLSIYKMDIERINYFLVSYLKLRQEKIEKYYFHIVHNESKYDGLLSMEEQEFLRSYYAIANKLIMDNGAFDTLPTKKQKLFEHPPQPSNAGAFFFQSTDNDSICIMKNVDPEYTAKIIKKEAHFI
jgi:hypothetical protein